MNRSITRRAMLATLPAALAGQTSRSRSSAKALPNVGEFVRLTDPTTETSIVRLTSLKSSSFLPASSGCFVSLKERFLLFSSNRTGTLCPFQLDLRTGTIRQIANTRALKSESLCLDPKEHWLYFLDGASLQRADVSKKDLRRIAIEAVADDVAHFSFAPNGVLFVVRAGNLERMNNGETSPLAKSIGPFCLANPNGNGCLFTRELAANEREYWFAASAATKPVLLAKGAVSDPHWAPDGNTLLFLRDVATPTAVLSEIHEVGLDGASERCLAPTSQFATFSPNFDATVFVGASRSKAQPNIVLLLRSAKREMTLCQHHSTQPRRVSPAFSPDARRVYFQSDEEGQSAIYSVNVEQLVEPYSENIEG